MVVDMNRKYIIYFGSETNGNVNYLIIEDNLTNCKKILIEKKGKINSHTAEARREYYPFLEPLF